ncbi:hypothetical protein I6N91_00325 [Arthrobacter sp. MSA 4-2]|uniref:DUF6308 family protein n=1 Tax=Arthrobacter sp. MSA 4-2 TaxID=2794349 RepID=UPI0018E73E1E|nr:DUF6308 family protein [Arthrobacter sp. MSA 4-2]MBJ2119420.1 hypothetical protein [Arthrobacter sp. MSA 4-2]
MSYPAILDADHVAEAAALVRRYYLPLGGNTNPRTGTRFDDWAGGGDHPSVADRITADDLVAVSFLSVDIKGRAAIGLLEKHAKEINELLQQIPVDLDLWDADIDALNSPDSPASQLWHVLRGGKYGRWGIGPTRASKIMARKRPRLIPIYDSVVRPLMGLDHSGGQWTTWHAALNDESGLPARLEVIRRAAEAPANISALRVMDIVLWMHGIELGLEPVNDDDDVVGAEN